MLRAHPVVLTATVIYLAVIGVVTLGPQPVDSSTDGWVYGLVGEFARFDLTAWISYSLIEFTANIALFVPLGWLLLTLVGRRRWWLVLLLGFAISGGIEAAQLMLPARVSDPRDIVANGLGTGIGVVLAVLFRRIGRANDQHFRHKFRADDATAS